MLNSYFPRRKVLSKPDDVPSAICFECHIFIDLRTSKEVRVHPVDNPAFFQTVNMCGLHAADYADGKFQYEQRHLEVLDGQEVR